jgi:pSer/pThr/pTyr-binding forkhead associated (FHA) protein
MEQALTLTFMSGSRDGEVVQLATSGSPQSVSIGRNVPCELVITDDPDMSRRHARIFWGGSSWMLEDLNSSNGTFIGEFKTARRLSESTAINNGEIFRVGLTRLRFCGVKNEREISVGAVAAEKGKYLS